MVALLVLGVEDRHRQLILGKIREISSEKCAFPERKIIEIERSVAPVVHRLPVVGGQLSQTEGPRRRAVPGPGLKVGLVERPRPKAEMVGGPAEHVKPGPPEEQGIDAAKKIAHRPAVDLLAKTGRQSFFVGEPGNEEKDTLAAFRQATGQRQPRGTGADDADVAVAHSGPGGDLFTREVHAKNAS